MFVLYEMCRTVRIDPKYLALDRKDAITDELNRLLSNRVIVDVGLCMALWDIKSIGLGTSFPGDGGVHSEVAFRFAVFRPFQDEILLGKIKNMTREGVHITLGFFDDIIIPPEALMYPSKFEEREQVWVWEYELEDDSGEMSKHDMVMERGQMLKFRVIGEDFDDSSAAPVAPNAQTSETSIKKQPYSLVGSINEPGLGLLTWW